VSGDGPGRDDLLAWRREFPILERCTYLVSHSLGAMPRGVAERLAGFADAWATRGVRAWAEGWWELPVDVGDEVGALIGAPRGSVVMQPNVSIAHALLLSALDFDGARNAIVCEAVHFPSVLYVLHAHEATGAVVREVPSEDGFGVELERLLEAIDERTRLVAVSHVVYRSGLVQDLAAIVRRAHEVGALVLADLYQSAGTLPVDVAAWDVDFACGGSVKWLCGGPGAGYLYVAPRHHGLRPRLTGWMAHERPFEFETAPIDYARGARRFLTGTPAVPALVAARAGYEILARVGVDAIRRKSLRQVSLARELALARGLVPRGPVEPDRRGGMLVVDLPHAEAVARELVRREVIVDHRPGAGIRLSPHFYTTDAEIRHAFETIGTVLDSGEYGRPGEARHTT
jgi:kynureninase